MWDMGLLGDIANIIFVIGLIYGAINTLPPESRNRVVSMVYRRPSLKSFKRQKKLVLNPVVTTIVVEEPKTFLDYVRTHLGENLKVIERMAEGEPDLLVESQNFQERFYIETVFISDFDEEGDQKGLKIDYLESYQAFEESRDMKIFFVIGEGGQETQPETVYILSVSEASPFMPMEFLARFERPEPDLPIMYYYMKLR